MTRVRSIIAAVVIAAAIGIAALQLTPTISDAGMRATIDSVPDAGLDAGALCALRAGYANGNVMSLWFGPDAGGGYAIMNVCVPVYDADAGAWDGSIPILPSGYEVLPDLTVVGADVWDGGPQIEIWRQGHPSAPYPCACAKDATCLNADGGPAPSGLTLAAGQWGGAGCLPKSCVELAGNSSWPAECPQ
ncbi:MAG: hypothetical protein FJ298_14295 [Planctomycetes bacterium]|nr:hypothetical protein [Planctomycetota bacterium]